MGNKAIKADGSYNICTGCQTTKFYGIRSIFTRSKTCACCNYKFCLDCIEYIIRPVDLPFFKQNSSVKASSGEMDDDLN